MPAYAIAACACTPPAAPGGGVANAGCGGSPKAGCSAGDAYTGAAAVAASGTGAGCAAGGGCCTGTGGCEGAGCVTDVGCCAGAGVLLGSRMCAALWCSAPCGGACINANSGMHERGSIRGASQWQSQHDNKGGHREVSLQNRRPRRGGPHAMGMDTRAHAWLVVSLRSSGARAQPSSAPAAAPGSRLPHAHACSCSGHRSNDGRGAAEGVASRAAACLAGLWERDAPVEHQICQLASR